MSIAKPKATAKAATAEAKTTTAKKPAAPKVAKAKTASADDNQRRSMIAEAAYFYAEKRGFQEGNPEDDWFKAEQDISRLFS